MKSLNEITAGIEKVKHQRERERKQSGLTPTETLSSFVSHKHGPSLLPCFSLSVFPFTLLICFYLRPAGPTTMIGVLTPPPPPRLPVQRLTPKGSGGEAFPLNRTVDFPQGKFFHSFTRKSSPPTTSGSSISPFSFAFSVALFFSCSLVQVMDPQ